MDEEVKEVSAIEPDNRGKWYVIQTLSGQENKIRDSINRQAQQDEQWSVYQALVPEEIVREIRNGKQVTIRKKLYPGYVLVRMDLYREDGQVDENVWMSVRTIPGVMGFLGSKRADNLLSLSERQVIPRPLSESEFLQMVPQTSEDAVPRLESKWKVGDRVQIKDGAFMGYEGDVSKIDDKGRLTVIIMIFGRMTPVELEFWQVEAAV